YGEATALLAGDALIVLAFETVALGAAQGAFRAGPLVRIVSRAAGAPFGLAAGQAWELEPNASSEQCRSAKTAALFVAATMSGALAGGGDADRWRTLGQKLGEAYQVADDLLDACAIDGEADKPVGRDADLGRPSAVRELGVDGAASRLEELIAEAVASIPPVDGADSLADLVRLQAVRLAPKGIAQSAA
ncbi:MAG: polyprenyl synthetase family protein, partial [Pseudomonadota bacterium]